MVALPPPRCMAEFRAYIAALQSNAVPGSEQRAASSEQRAASSEHACFYIGKYRKIYIGKYENIGKYRKILVRKNINPRSRVNILGNILENIL
jgi:hypothetical protein